MEQQTVKTVVHGHNSNTFCIKFQPSSKKTAYGEY